MAISYGLKAEILAYSKETTDGEIHNTGMAQILLFQTTLFQKEKWLVKLMKAPTVIQALIMELRRPIKKERIGMMRFLIQLRFRNTIFRLAVALKRVIMPSPEAI